ncbi:MAG: hypothetical protein ABIK33_01065 [candidate division WOR-3 bacterium]
MVIVSYNHSILPTLPEIALRQQFYGIASYPTVVFDGTDVVFEPNPNAYDSVYTQHIHVAKSVVPNYNLKLFGYAGNNTGELQIKISPADTLRHDSVYAFVMVCEDSVRGSMGGYFNYIIRQFYSFPINLFYPDSFDTTITFSHSIPTNKMRGVLFVQDVGSKKVLQAIKTNFIITSKKGIPEAQL